MGGYEGRHRTVYKKGLSVVCRKMDAGLSRLWFHNLEQVDRLVANHGRQPCHPFLDEDAIDFVTKSPYKHICDLFFPDGAGDKLLLRRACAKIGLPKATTSQIMQSNSWLEISSSQDTFMGVSSNTVNCNSRYRCVGKRSAHYIKCGRNFRTEGPKPAPSSEPPS